MTILIAILGLIFLIFIHELGHMLTAKAFGVRVPEFAIGFGPPLIQKQFGKTLYSFRIILLGGFAKIAGMPGDDDEGPDTYYAKALWKRALIIFGGPGVNIIFAALLFSAIFMVQGVPTSENPQPEAEVGSVTTESMASESGLQSGDELMAVGGQPVQSWEEFTGAITERSPGEEVVITVERDGQERTVSGELGSAPNDPDQAQVGIRPSIGEVTHSPFVALWEGGKQTVTLAGAHINGLYQLATGQLDFFENVNGPVGITTIGSEFISEGVINAILIGATISLILGIMNLLPILPLDGGHLVMIAIEKIRGGKPVSVETMNKVATVGLMLMLTLMLFATYADISKIITGQPFIPQ